MKIVVIRVNNFLFTGAPSSGKTTIIKKIIKLLPVPANGFYTQEERIGDKRVGFMMHTLDGEQGYLAHQDIESDFHIRRYGVSIKNIDGIACPSILPKDNPIIILDEIGKMECFSPKFVDAARKALDAPQIVIGTITYGHLGFIQEVKERGDVELIEVTEENRDSLPSELLDNITPIVFQK